MFIVSIGFGLGNQMFAYAYFVKLRKKYPDVKLKIDTEYSFEKAHNGYELKRIFGIDEEQCSLEEFNILADEYPHNSGKLKKYFYKFKRKVRHILGIRKKSFIKQKDYTVYYPELLEYYEESSYYIQGVFANEKYFSDIKDTILEIYQFPQITDNNNLQWKMMIENTESISLHIRRGDYLEWGLTLLGDDYYEKAVKCIEKLVDKECEIFVFTDDVEWAKNKYSQKINYHVVSGNSGNDNFRDMQLMSLCKHNIVANSSFSFWGAYLNQNPDRRIVASAQPYDGCQNSFACKDWILI